MNNDNYYTLLMYFVILSSQYTIDSSSIIFAIRMRINGQSSRVIISV